MTFREVMDTALWKRKQTQAWLARQLGISPQNFNLRLGRDSIRADEFLQILDILGIDVSYTLRENGEPLRDHVSGHGRRLIGNSDKITFDTANSEAIANTFYEDGVNEFNENGEAVELYVDGEGRYFLAEYHTDPTKDKVRSIPASVASAFADKYGSVIEKGPKAE